MVYKIDGGILPSPVKTNTRSGGLLSQLPSYPGPAVIAHNADWPGPPESSLPETVASFSKQQQLSNT